MTAHPKLCPTTGELHFYGYGPFAPHVTYYVAYGARLGVLARRGEGSAVRWFDIEPCYAFHVLNATETIPGQIEIDVVRFPDFWRDDTHRLPPTTLHRWSIDTAAGKVSEQTLDDRSVEF